MNRQSFLGVVALLSLLVLGGCETLSELASGLDKPTARVTGARLAGLDLNGVEVVFDVDVTNPYSVPLPLAKLDVALISGGRTFVTGEAAKQGTIPASGHDVVTVRARVTFIDALNVLKGVRPGAVVPYEAALGISVDAPVVGLLRLPLSHTGELPIPTLPTFSVQGIRWESLSLTKASAVLRLDVGNTNQFPFDLDRLQYALKLGGHDVATSSVSQQVSLAPGQKKPIELGFSLTPKDLGLAAFSLLKGDSAGYSLNGTLQAMTPFGPLIFPVGDSGQTPMSH